MSHESPDIALTLEGRQLVDDLGPDHATTLDKALDSGLVMPPRPVIRRLRALSCVNFAFATGEAFIDLDCPREPLVEGLGLHGLADAVEHGPGGLLGDAERPNQFRGADGVL